MIKPKGTLPPNQYNEHAWIIGDPEIGEDVWIGAFTVVDGSGGLRIGNGSTISCGVQIYTHSTVRRCLSERRYNKVDQKPVEVGDYVFIGAGAIILKGSKIGHHCVIGAGAVVLEGTVVPPYSLVGGVPAKILKTGKNELAKYLEAD